jgi:hypothetical protein
MSQIFDNTNNINLEINKLIKNKIKKYENTDSAVLEWSTQKYTKIRELSAELIKLIEDLEDNYPL